MKTNKHLTQEERYTIERMRKEGYNQARISECLGRDPGTISREIRRNSGQRGYRHKQAQGKAEDRRFASRRRGKFTPVMQAKVEAHLRDDLSPEQVTGVMRRKGEETVSHERIYQHVYEDHRRGGTLYKHLRQCRKKRRKRLGRQDRRGRIQNRVSIEERPAVVEKRFYYGDWEADLVAGAAHEGFLLTLVQRKCGHLLMHPLGSKKADEVSTAIILELWPFVGKIRSLTMDNGKEFSGHEVIAALLQTKVYFAHPYASWERGTNENTNGLIRQYLPKGMSFRNLDMEQCKDIERKLNMRPRKRLGFATPMDYRDKLIAS
jgi:IS30 family transposase